MELNKIIFVAIGLLVIGGGAYFLLGGSFQDDRPDSEGLANGVDVLFVDNQNSQCNNEYEREDVLDPSSPWCFVDDIVRDNIQAGDTVYIRGGEYNYAGQSVTWWDKDYPEDQPVTLTSYPGEEVVFTQNYKEYEEPNNNLWIQYSEIPNIWVTVPPQLPTGDKRHMMAAYEDDTLLMTYNPDKWSQFNSMQYAEGVIVKDSQLYLKLEPGKDPNDIPLIITSNNKYRMWNFERSENVIFANVTIKNPTVGITIQDSTGITIDNVNFINGVRNGVYMQSGNKDITVKNSNFLYHFNPDWAWQWIKTQNIGRRHEGTAIVSGGTDGLNVHGNHIDGWFNGIGVSSKPGAEKTNIYDNYMVRMYDDGLEFEPGCNNLEAWNNTIIDSFSAVSTVPAKSANNDCYIHHNVLDSTMEVLAKPGRYWEGGCFKIIGNFDNPLADGLRIEHNTCVGNGLHVSAGDDPVFINMVFKDNIFYNPMDNPEGQSVANNMGRASNNVVWDYNLYFVEDDENLFGKYNGGGIYKTLADALASSDATDKWDQNSIEADPKLQDWENHDYQPKKDSPVCGAASDGSDIGALPCKE